MLRNKLFYQSIQSEISKNGKQYPGRIAHKVKPNQLTIEVQVQVTCALLGFKIN
tara:strand:+ start:39 stop:200 length:162 start_codon:yes stop_codon:yes gene_type:complete